MQVRKEIIGALARTQRPPPFLETLKVLSSVIFVRRAHTESCEKQLQKSRGRNGIMRKKRIAATLLCAFAFALLPCGVWAEELLVGGQTVGIEISAEGVIVSGFSRVETEEGELSPAEEAGFLPGDLIVKLNGQPIRTAEDLIGAVAQLGGDEAAVDVRRGEGTAQLKVRPALSPNGQWLLGLWLRDGVSGVGTLTFVEPESGLFGALGHSVNEEDSGVRVPLRSGRLWAAEIVGVSPGSPGTPGELSGSSDSTDTIGSVEKNTPAGIFGHLSALPSGQLLQTGQMRTGEACIISTLSGHEAREYAVEIDRVYTDGGETRALLTVTDSALISGAGGIVQGMSGSPIIQDGSIVGAVTHVFVNDPRRGFAIGIYDMLGAAHSEARAA